MKLMMIYEPSQSVYPISTKKNNKKIIENVKYKKDRLLHSVINNWEQSFKTHSPFNPLFVLKGAYTKQLYLVYSLLHNPFF